MLSKVETRKRIGEESSKGKLLNDIEAISKALYLEKTRPRSVISTASSRSKSVGKTHIPNPHSKPNNVKEDPSNKDKKSIWSWKGLKALTHVRNRRFNCCFSLQVHSIEGLPLYFNDLSLVVHWKRRDSELLTRPSRVFQGVAEFEEELTHICSIYGSRNGPHHSAKYEAKHFLLFASVSNAPELDLGKHRVDLTRLLPLTLEELEEEKCSGKWTTSFRLSGKGKGGTINVSFGYSVVGDNSTKKMNNAPEMLPLRHKTENMSQSSNRGILNRAGSVPVNSPTSGLSTEDVKDLHEVLPLSKSGLSDSINVLYKKFDEEKNNLSVEYKPETCVFRKPSENPKTDLVMSSDSGEKIHKNECEISDFSVIEHGIESSSKDHVNSEGNDDSPLEGADSSKKDDNLVTRESLMKELESALNSVSDLAKEESDSQEEESGTSNQEQYLEFKSNYKSSKGKSHSLDVVAESIASEFLDMLGIEHSPFGFSSESEPESPREQLLRQFEMDALANGGSLFNFDMDENQTNFEDMNDKLENEEVREKTTASMLEDLETEALMREWGLNENAFHSSPPSSTGGFGSPIDIPPEDPLQLPPLGEGLGPFVQTNDGGFLRSMNPSLFKDAKSGGSLIMQVSSPVVVPAKMGSGIMEILKGLASVGIEKLSMQANKLMPLEDITGKTMEQVAWEAAPSLEAAERQDFLQHESDIGQNTLNFQKKPKGKPFGPGSSKFESSSIGNQSESEYVSLEDLAPLAMDKIEALSMEGLRIQSNMSNEDSPSNISPQSIGEFSAFKGTTVNLSDSLGLEGAGGLQLLDIKDNGDDIDGLMGLSLTLDEWMRIDSGEIDGEDDQISDRTSKILAAHDANYLELARGRRGRGKGYKGKCGLLGNNFTVALMVQLRDPLRNFEPVGTPMLSLIQVERLFVPPKPKIYSVVSELRRKTEEDDDEIVIVKKETAEAKEEVEGIAHFKISEVHVAGLKTEAEAEVGKKKIWGSKNQQQSGSRWLLANGMGKKNKHPLMKSTPSSATATVQGGESLWSISSRGKGGAKWKELGAGNPHVRNPNLIFSNEKKRLW